MPMHDQDPTYSGTRARRAAGGSSRRATTTRDPETDPTPVVVRTARTEVAESHTVLEPASRRPDLSESQRMRVPARPLRPVDTHVVEKATWMMTALDVLDNAEALPAVIDPVDPLALLDDDAKSSAVVILEGNTTGRVPAIHIVPPPRKKRHWASGAVILALVAAVVAAGVATVTPLATGHEQLAMAAHGPLGLPVALDTVNHAPSGQWVAQVGIQPDSEIGGGAGPGVKAPGSAGLPLSSVTVVVNTAPAPSPDVGGPGISAAPLSPWPPSWAYTAPPGYSSFAVNGSGGFYSWAFGQCTWWAQYQRRDENLQGMGNAQYWASGARARGYTVSSTPRAGATIVFQPGVEGAGGAGHVAHVVKVYPDNWVLISEMNFYWDGGGWGRVDYRYAYAGSGVQFIY